MRGGVNLDEVKKLYTFGFASITIASHIHSAVLGHSLSSILSEYYPPPCQSESSREATLCATKLAYTSVLCNNVLQVGIIYVPLKIYGPCHKCVLPPKVHQKEIILDIRYYNLADKSNNLCVWVLEKVVVRYNPLAF